MAGSGRVTSVWVGSVPDTGAPATGIRVDKEIARPGYDRTHTGIEFYIRVPENVRRPEISDPITWGPHKATIAGVDYRKLTWELDPDRPLY